MKTINAAIVAAALAAKGYGNTVRDFERYLEDNHTPETPLNNVVRELDPEWKGDFGGLTVADAEQVEQIGEAIGLPVDTDTAADFLNAAPQVDG